MRARAVFDKPLSSALDLGVDLGEPSESEELRSSFRELLAPPGEPRATDWRDIELPLSAAQQRENLPFV